MAIGFGLGMATLREEWYVVRGRDALTHWLRILIDPRPEQALAADSLDRDETTYCGQTFYDVSTLTPRSAPITCFECQTREDARDLSTLSWGDPA